MSPVPLVSITGLQVSGATTALASQGQGLRDSSQDLRGCKHRTGHYCFINLVLKALCQISRRQRKVVGQRGQVVVETTRGRRKDQKRRRRG